jgi:hypothetical protein
VKHLAFVVLGALAALAVACGRDTDAILKAPPKGRAGSGSSVTPSPRVKLDGLTTALPAGWTATHDSRGAWSFSSPKLTDGRTTTVVLAPMSVAVDPTPADYLALREQLWDRGTLATIVATQKLPDGFAITVEVKPAATPDQPRRETYVLRHLGATWLDCRCERVSDEKIRDQVIALCSSAQL